MLSNWIEERFCEEKLGRANLRKHNAQGAIIYRAFLTLDPGQSYAARGWTVVVGLVFVARLYLTNFSFFLAKMKTHVFFSSLFYSPSQFSTIFEIFAPRKQATIAPLLRS